MTLAQDDLWTLTWSRRQIDADAMAAALARTLTVGPLGFRDRVLVRDTLQALRDFWGAERFQIWLQTLHGRPVAERILAEELGPPGFRRLGDRLMQPTTPDIVQAFLRDLGGRLRLPASVHVGGAIALILADKLHRATEDVDVVDEIPAELRQAHELVRELEGRHGLVLTHFQSHYLPDGWRSRAWSLGRFGVLDVAVIDAYDVFVGKLFSRREKDFDDLRTLVPQLDRAVLTARVLSNTTALRSDLKMLDAASHNWYVLFGEAFPGTPQSS